MGKLEEITLKVSWNGKVHDYPCPIDTTIRDLKLDLRMMSTITGQERTDGKVEKEEDRFPEVANMKLTCLGVELVSDEITKDGLLETGEKGHHDQLKTDRNTLVSLLGKKIDKPEIDVLCEKTA